MLLISNNWARVQCNEVRVCIDALFVILARRANRQMLLRRLGHDPLPHCRRRQSSNFIGKPVTGIKQVYCCFTVSRVRRTCSQSHPIVSRSFPSRGAGFSRLRVFTVAAPSAICIYLRQSREGHRVLYRGDRSHVLCHLCFFERVRVGDVAGFTAKIVQDVLHRHGDGAAERFCGLPCHTRC